MDGSSQTAVAALHTIAALVWVAGTAGTQLLAARLGRRVGEGDAALVVAFMGRAGRAHSRILLPAAGVLAITGGALVRGTDSTVRDDWWIGGSIGLVAVSLFVALLMLLPESRAITSDSVEEGDDAEVVQWRIHRWLMLQRGQLLLLACALALMVVQPA